MSWTRWRWTRKSNCSACMGVCGKRRNDFAILLQREARGRGKLMAQTMAFAFRRRYLIPPTDERFLNATEEDIAVDFWAHKHWDDPKLGDEFSDPDFEAAVAAEEAASVAREQAHAAGVPAVERAEEWETLANDQWDGAGQHDG